MSWTQVTEEIAEGVTVVEINNKPEVQGTIEKPKVEVNRKKVLKAKESILTEAHTIILSLIHI